MTFHSVHDIFVQCSCGEYNTMAIVFRFGYFILFFFFFFFFFFCKGDHLVWREMTVVRPGPSPSPGIPSGAHIPPLAEVKRWSSVGCSASTTNNVAQTQRDSMLNVQPHTTPEFSSKFWPRRCDALPLQGVTYNWLCRVWCAHGHPLPENLNIWFLKIFSKNEPKKKKKKPQKKFLNKSFFSPKNIFLFMSCIRCWLTFSSGIYIYTTPCLARGDLLSPCSVCLPCLSMDPYALPWKPDFKAAPTKEKN